MAAIAIGPLPEEATEAAARFHADVLPRLLARLDDAGDGHLALVFPPAPHDHTAWRLAAVQGLARKAAPLRVNGVAGDDNAAIAEALHYLHHAPGVTGQLLAVGANAPDHC